MSEVEQQSRPDQGRSGSTDSLDKELDWMISQDDQPADDEMNNDGQYEDEHNRGRNDATPDHVGGERDSQENNAKHSMQQSTAEENSRDNMSPPRESPQEMETRHTPSPPSSPKPSSNAQNKTEEPDRVGSVKKSDDDDLKMSEDQQKANDELNMKLDLLGYNEDPPPEYDVTERVRQLNEELANDPSPEDDRERSIKFKDNLIDLVAPPPDIPTDDEAPEDKAATGASDSEEEMSTPRSNEASDMEEGDDDEHKNSRESNNSSETDNSADDNNSDKSSKKTSDNNNKVLIERNGTFDLVDASELTAEERKLYNVPDTDESEEDRKSESRTPSPPSEPRPKTAGPSRARAAGRQQRAQSAPQQRSQEQSKGDEWDSDFTYTSPYAMTPEQRRELARKNQAEKKQQREEEEKRQKDEEKKTQDSNDAFNAWLRKKRDQHSRERKEREENEKQAKQEEEENKRDPDGAYKGWVKAKKDQGKKQKDEEKKRQQEIDEGWYSHSEKECEQAFKKWLRAKNQEVKSRRNEEKQKSRIHRLLERRSRKSQQLAKAIKQAQSYRYVDYYGYRY